MLFSNWTSPIAGDRLRSSSWASICASIAAEASARRPALILVVALTVAVIVLTRSADSGAEPSRPSESVKWCSK